MTQTTKDKRLLITWAVDPFSKDGGLHREAVRSLVQIIKRQPVLVRPVYIVEDDAQYVPEITHHELEDRATEVVAAGLEALVGKLDREFFLPVRIVPAGHSSIRAKVRTLVKDARKAQSDLIVATTHARSGAARFFLGSFAETLSLTSTVPILLINPQWNGQEIFEHILFATDLSPDSYAVFGQVISFAQAMKSRLTVYHKTDGAPAPQWESLLTPDSITHDQWFEQRLERRKRVDRWTKEACLAGVDAISLIDEAPQVSVTDAILAQAVVRPGIVALAGQSSGTDTALLGSTARRLIREATCPVWILHSQPYFGEASNVEFLEDDNQEAWSP
ncbi:universal stress protein [Bdellovibrionota bacterium FG-1]